jgi:hypothetical protein
MSTELRVFKADAGLKWLKAGWLIFKTQPMTFIFMHLFIGIVSLLSLFLPFLQIIAALATPFLTAGFYQAVITKQQGGSIMLADILKPFTKKGNRLGLLRLALYQMGAGILVGVLANALFVDAITIMQQPNVDPNLVVKQIMASLSMGNVLLFLVVLSVYISAFAYAIPLVYFNKEQQILTALKRSLTVFYYNILPLSVFSAVCGIFMFISMLLSMLPLLILMPICYISFFVSYQAIFMPVVPPSDDKGVKPLNSEQSGRFDA